MTNSVSRNLDCLRQTPSIEYCFETINWSPAVGFPNPNLELMIDVAAANGFKWISFDVKSLDSYVEAGRSLASLRGSLEGHGLKMLALHSILIDENAYESELSAKHITEYCNYLHPVFMNTSLKSHLNLSSIAAIQRVNSIARNCNVQFTMEYFAHSHVNSIDKLRNILKVADITGPNIMSPVSAYGTDLRL